MIQAAAAAGAPQRVLVRGPNWLGDLVMATPAFRALRAGLPGAHLTLQVQAGLEPLLAGAPWFDAVETLAAGGLRARWREACRLRRQRLDLALCLPDSWSAALRLRAAGARRLVGYDREGRGLVLDLAPPLPRAVGGRVLLPRERHALGLVEAIGCRAQGTAVELFVTQAEDTAAVRALEEAGLDPDRPRAAVAPGASYGPAKLWPASSFARVADALADAGAAIVLLGTARERSLAARVGRAMRAPAADLTGRLDLGALKALLRRSRLLLCNDAGARHVAVALGTPCVVLLGPTSLTKTSLNLERVRVLVHEVGCRPCYHRVCPTDHRCLRGLAPERVIEAALAEWEGGSRRAAPPGPVPARASIDYPAGP